MIKKLLDNKLSIGTTGVGGSLAVILVWIIEAVTKTPVPPDVAIALGVVLGAAIGHIAGYQKAEKDREEVE